MDDEQEKQDARMKEIIQEGIEKWLDKKFAEFGKWSFYGILAAFISGMAYFVVSVNAHK